jgi:hypothetical protein
MLVKAHRYLPHNPWTIEVKKASLTDNPTHSTQKGTWVKANKIHNTLTDNAGISNKPLLYI